jgi:hypothetical protein
MGFSQGTADELLLTCIVCREPFGMTSQFCGECGANRMQVLTEVAKLFLEHRHLLCQVLVQVIMAKLRFLDQWHHPSQKRILRKRNDLLKVRYASKTDNYALIELTNGKIAGRHLFSASELFRCYRCHLF